MSAEVHLGDVVLTAMTRDLSEGGCGMELKQALKENAEATLGLFLVIDDVEEERLPPLWVKGRVVWTAEQDDGRCTAGIRFEVITSEQKAWVRSVITQLGSVTKSPATL
jgi:PilZ domain